MSRVFVLCTAAWRNAGDAGEPRGDDARFRADADERDASRSLPAGLTVVAQRQRRLQRRLAARCAAAATVPRQREYRHAIALVAMLIPVAAATACSAA
ncbi:hypothetical protein LBW59_18980 [Ralstonia solanacearum]|uniref:Uncharacterized protein n=1 Tax=Ralstonia solanacearum TaxID=305 RepID=A0AAW5ZRT4_RALSL|nr:hypothetical protein [Ralstonia solanacearum]MDB0527278.1 hypothetical protein [Ralstonia solanacearum]MDB0572851.1 hypothetical protein [Ralstonia solanacearum]